MSQSSHNSITTCAKIFELQNSFLKTIYKESTVYNRALLQRAAKVSVSHIPLHFNFHTGTCDFNDVKENYF